MKFNVKKTVLLILGCFSIVSGLYWKFSVFPYIQFRGGTLQSETIELTAGVSDKLHYYFRIGDEFSKGSPLFSFQALALRGGLNKVESEIERLSQEYTDIHKKMTEVVEERSFLALQVQQDDMPLVLEELAKEIDDWKEKGENTLSNLKELNSQKDVLNQKLDTATVFSSFNGIVLDCYQEQDKFVKQSDKVMLICSDEFWVETEIPEKYLSKLEIGQKAFVLFYPFSTKKYEANVTWISPIVQKGFIRIRLDGGNFPKHPGLSSQVILKCR
jgi:hypothetical protein